VRGLRIRVVDVLKLLAVAPSLRERVGYDLTNTGATRDQRRFSI
jgi:hypothetical protein